MYDEGTDDEVFNDEWADAADMETPDINDLERDFLREIVISFLCIILFVDLCFC